MKNNYKNVSFILYFTAIYILAFTIYSIIKHNYEFLFYTFIMTAFIIAIVIYHRRHPIPTGVVFGMALVGVLHILAGNVHILGTRIYDIWIISDLIKMDNLIHLIGGYVSVLISYTLLSQHLDKDLLGKNKIVLCLILLLMASGIGALNEIFEFVAVVFFDAAQKVGNYFNNALDLLVNLLGAAIACFYIVLKKIKN